MSSIAQLAQLANLHLVPSRASSSIIVRHPGILEVLPHELVGDLSGFTIDRHWQWVAEYSGEIVGQILCAPIHGVLQFIRIIGTSTAPRIWAVVALRQVLAEASQRGLKGYMCFLDDSHPQEVKLMRIVERHGGTLIPACGAWAAGSTVGGY